MRSHITGRLPAILARPPWLGSAVIGISGTAFAGNRLHDYVYADSFGNLIVQSPYGYERIIVGDGYIANQLSGYSEDGEPGVAYTKPTSGYGRYGYYRDTCYRRLYC
jgi:hypothetical protein